MNIKELHKRFESCSCGREHSCDIADVKIGHGVINEIGALCEGYEKILLVSDENTYKYAKAVESILFSKIEKSIVLKAQKDVVIPNEEKIEELENALSRETELIIGVGSGVINDLCKHVSFKRGLPYYIAATAPSMDGYASVGAALILGEMKVTLNARPPKAIIADTEILKCAPIDMLRAGYGDIVGKFSCLNDWRLGALVNGEYFCQRVYDLTFECVERVKNLAEGIQNRDENSIELLTEALITVGVAMSYVKNSRTASGSEHHLSHFFEITGILDGKPYFAHGIDVIFSAVCVQKLREEIIKSEKPNAFKLPNEAEYEGEIKRIYKSASDGVIELQKKTGFYTDVNIGTYTDNWDKIKSLLSETPSYSEMLGYVRKIGLDINDFEALYGKEKIKDATFFAKDLKDRYTVLWLYFYLNYNSSEEK